MDNKKPPGPKAQEVTASTEGRSPQVSRRIVVREVRVTAIRSE
jgi:hypothetical protein